MNANAQKILSKLTLEQKASLCSGYDFWHLKGNTELKIPTIMVTDGPHGLRKQAGETDHIGLLGSAKATCFPTASATASTWEPELLHAMGEALGEECLKEEVSVLLGPGANIKRSPLCGRNFEYISEDPYLTGRLGASLVNGIQSKGIGTSLKHFAVNNQEYRRMTSESVVDERALREIYLAGFEHIVKESQPWTVMCAYNKLEGTYCSDHKRLLTDILRTEWGFKGLVVSDWGATNDRVEGIKAGMDLEMPSSNGLNDKIIVDAVNEGRLSVENLDAVVLRVLNLIFKSEESLKQNSSSIYESNKNITGSTGENIQNSTYSADDHHALARKIAGKSIVLLKNADNILPLKKTQKIVVVGNFAMYPRYQGAGSSLINPMKLESAIDELDHQQLLYTYCQGYTNEDKTDEALFLEAVETAKSAEVVVVFAGLPDRYESEGFDREHLSMPESHNSLIKAIANVNQKVIVVLQNGAPVSMPWLSRVKAVVECYLGGQAGGPAAIDVLYGDVNPSGKLAETFPLQLEDCAATPWFGMGPKTVEYRESVYVGYRYYDTAKQNVLFPFGYGLSYTSFQYSDMQIMSSAEKSRTENNRFQENETITVKVKVKNSGKVSGSEIVQLYIKDVESTLYRPEKELKGFKKVFLQEGEELEIQFTLDKRSFAYYNVNVSDWCVETGVFNILIGASSQDIRLEQEIMVESLDYVISPDYKKSAPEYYIGKQEGEENAQSHSFLKNISDSSFQVVLGREIPVRTYAKGESYTINSTLGDVRKTFVGSLLYKMVFKMMKKMMSSTETDNSMALMAEAMVKDLPIRSLVLVGGGKITFAMAEGLLHMMNRKPLKGIAKLIKG